MERVCFLGRIRPDRLDEYRARHREVWPEMTDALREAGWGNYTLFLTDDAHRVPGDRRLRGSAATDGADRRQRPLAGADAALFR